MTKAEEIMSQNASIEQKERWAIGNAISIETDTRKGNSGFAEYRFSDGSKIVRRAMVPLHAE